MLLLRWIGLHLEMNREDQKVVELECKCMYLSCFYGALF